MKALATILGAVRQPQRPGPRQLRDGGRRGGDGRCRRHHPAVRLRVRHRPPDRCAAVSAGLVPACVSPGFVLGCCGCPLLRLLRAGSHDQPVKCVEASGEHGAVVSASWDRMLHVWDPVGAHFEQHSGGICCDRPLTGAPTCIAATSGPTPTARPRAVSCRARRAYPALTPPSAAASHIGGGGEGRQHIDSVANRKAYTMSISGEKIVVGTSDRHVHVYDIRRVGQQPLQRRQSSLRGQTRCM